MGKVKFLSLLKPVAGIIPEVEQSLRKVSNQPPNYPSNP
jgi:hypothetical protein